MPVTDLDAFIEDVEYLHAESDDNITLEWSGRPWSEAQEPEDSCSAFYDGMKKHIPTILAMARALQAADDLADGVLLEEGERLGLRGDYLRVRAKVGQAKETP